ncbi:unnamed protein product [Thlaspi arvense]|uniref:Glycosyltransferase n=1 Tax=Thlaspi arvense TaxID=13288 RepID=A0AAU9T0W7_THLAR|nr:unnamed protein product [Thlaspi arvense]
MRAGLFLQSTENGISFTSLENLLLSLLRAGPHGPALRSGSTLRCPRRARHIHHHPSQRRHAQETVDKDVAAGRHVASTSSPFPPRKSASPKASRTSSMAKTWTPPARFTRARISSNNRSSNSWMSAPQTVSSPTCTTRGPPMLLPASASPDSSSMARPCSPAVSTKQCAVPTRHIAWPSPTTSRFVIPGLPDPITMMRSQLPDHILKPNRPQPKAIITPVRVVVTHCSNRYTQLVEQWRDAELRSYGVVSSILALWGLFSRNRGEKGQRAHKAVIGDEECLAFLKSKTPSSVLYICFGSACIFPDNQLMEIACGLEASGHNFIWVVFGKDDEKEGEKEKWLPKGEGDDNKGMGPTVVNLDHPSVGGFLTHCGWNSVIEGATAGLPMITWPLYAEHFYNERLVIQVLGIGVGLGKKQWSQWVWDFPENEVVGRLTIEDTVRRVMDAEDPAAKMIREKARALGKKAHEAMEEGGSSYQNLTVLIQELKDLREREADDRRKGIRRNVEGAICRT